MRLLRAGAVCALMAVAVGTASAQPPGSLRAFGSPVAPMFEGWYQNPDGSYTLSFGYFNRNTEEVVEIPVGPGNHIEPGAANQGQPTKFMPRRHWGVFGVKVPADFGYGRVVWTLSVHGQTFSIPGSLKRDWEIDARFGLPLPPVGERIAWLFYEHTEKIVEVPPSKEV